MMEELDLLKKDWNKAATTFEQYSEASLYAMIYKRSASVVKWILIISVLEFLVWCSLSFIFKSDDYLKKVNLEKTIKYLSLIDYVHYAIIGIFIVLFYKNYKKISVVTSTKQLMNDILKTRKTVQYYIWYNLGMITISLIFGIILALNNNQSIEKLNTNVNLKIGFIIGFIVFSIVFIGLFWLFYKLLYGMLLKRLLTNFKELKKLESDG